MTHPTLFLDGAISVYGGDSRQVLGTLPAASVDAVVTDPPYGLGFMGRAWDAPDGAAFAREFWLEVKRVLKPGGHVLAFGGTRTFHRLFTAIEDAGFEIRDTVAWIYGSGFPKSLDVGKAIDRAAGVEREVIGTKRAGLARPASDEAAQWEGWGTALKPAIEPICLARKPLEGTVAENVLRWGVGALNIDACRVATTDDLNGGAYAESGGRSRLTGDDRGGAAGGMFQAGKTVGSEFSQPTGRWPANVIHDGSDEVLAAFPWSDANGGNPREKRGTQGNVYGVGLQQGGDRVVRNDAGSAGRFFYSTKADADDRIGSKHPTVKRRDLMQYLVRLVTPPGGLVLDPFAGTGTTGEAAWLEGMRAILIERDAEHLSDIGRRMELVLNPGKRRAVARSRNKLMGAEGTPLFGGGDPEAVGRAAEAGAASGTARTERGADT